MPSLLVITVSYVVLFVLIAIHTKHSLDQITSISTPPPQTNQPKKGKCQQFGSKKQNTRAAIVGLLTESHHSHRT